MLKRFVITAIMGAVLFAAVSDERGDKIAKKYFDLKKANDMTATSKMTLIDGNGNKQIRVLQIFSKEMSNGTNSFTEFLDPADVKGTKFLTTAESNGTNTQRLYLPALKKIRRIASSDKDGKFMGSDFCYYDMEDHDYEDNSYEFIGENETLNNKEFANMKFYTIKFIPKDPESPYSYSKMWINMENSFCYQAIPFDKKGNPEKTIVSLSVENIQGILIARKMLVINQKEKHQTLMSMDDIKLNIGLKDNLFEVQNLK